VIGLVLGVGFLLVSFVASAALAAVEGMLSVFMMQWIVILPVLEIYDESRATRHCDRACIRGMRTTYSTQSAQVTAIV
jgi:hypothetical protein